MELDAHKLIFAIHDFGTFVDDCKILSKNLDEYFFVLVKKSMNQVIHSLVRAVDSIFLHYSFISLSCIDF